VGERNHATPQQIEALIDAHVRRNTAAALGKLGDARSVVPLIAALADIDAHVRRNTAAALGKLGDARSVVPLIATARDANGWVRSSAATALSKFIGWYQLVQRVALVQRAVTKALAKLRRAD
jgi:HEAT repeat protein